MVAKTTKM